MPTITVPEPALDALTATGPTMFFGLAESSQDGLRVVEHRSIEKRQLDDDQLRTNLLAWAANSGLGLVECHTHIDGDPACMSWTDVNGLLDWVPHVRWRIGGQPYVALVLGETTVDGLVWAGPDSSVQRLDRVILGTKLIPTTGRSFDRLASKEVNNAAVEERYSRQVALFGAAGQAALAAVRVVVVGLGGTGSHVTQQLALLGVGDLDLIDGDHVAPSNLNRLIGAQETDVGKRKVDVAARMVRRIRPKARVRTHPTAIEAGPPSLFHRADFVMSCVDDDASRLEIINRCTADGTVFIDLATDTGDSARGPWFGGRVLYSGEGERCPACMDLLDQDALRRAHLTPGQKAEEQRIYGVQRDALDGTGPAVVSVNGVIASLAVTEFAKAVTHVAEAAPLVTYRGDRGTVHLSADLPAPDCFYCARWPHRAP